MTVEARFVVIRNGVEMEMFTDKKAADQYDRMLDMAEELSTLLSASPLELNEADKEELAIYLAKNREELLYALQAKKRPTPSPKASKTKTKSTDEGKSK